MSHHRRTSGRKTRTLVSAIVATVLSVVSLGVSASATEELQAAVPSCVFLMNTGESVCVDNPDKLDAAAEKKLGVELLEPGETATATSSARATGKVIETAYIRTQLYEHSDFGGAIFTLANAEVCDDNTAKVANLAGYGWNDIVSSYISFSGCKTKIWADANYSGSYYGYYTKKSYVGDVLNDKASSVATH